MALDDDLDRTARRSVREFVRLKSHLPELDPLRLLPEDDEDEPCYMAVNVDLAAVASDGELVREVRPCGGRGRMFESCRAHGSTRRFSKARNPEKCTPTRVATTIPRSPICVRLRCIRPRPCGTSGSR